MVDVVLDHVGSWPAALVLGVAALVLALESGVLAGIVLPGSTTLVVLGLWSGASGTHPALPIVVAAAASAGGALYGWLRGRRRRGAHLPPGRLRARVDPAVRQARHWLATHSPGHGALVLAAGHWLAGTRTLGPRVAGGAGVPFRVLAPVIALSATAWAATVVLLARTLGQRVADDASWAPAVVLGLVGLALLVRHWRRTHAPRPG